MAKITLIKKKARDIVKNGINSGKTDIDITKELNSYLKRSKKAFETDKKRNFADVEAEMLRYKEFLTGATAKPEARQIATKVLKQADNELSAVWKDSPDAAIQTVEDGLKSGKSANELVKELDKKFKTGEFRAMTIVRTAKKGFNRLNVIQQALAAGIENFKYAGPSSGTEHDLCQRNVGKVFSINEIRSMRNGQREPVEAYMGGYNCRHHWEPVIDETAKEKAELIKQGYDLIEDEKNGYTAYSNNLVNNGQIIKEAIQFKKQYINPIIKIEKSVKTLLSGKPNAIKAVVNDVATAFVDFASYKSDKSYLSAISNALNLNDDVIVIINSKFPEMHKTKIKELLAKSKKRISLYNKYDDSITKFGE